MPSGWNVYYIVFLSALLALGIPAGLGILSSLLSPRRKSRPAPHVTGPGQSFSDFKGKRMNVRFFLAANASLALITLILALIPCASMAHEGVLPGEALRGLIAVISIAGFALLGLLYSTRKGDLSWLKSFHSLPKDEG